MAAPDTVVDFAEKLAAFDEHWSPKIVGQVNDLHVKLVKVLGEFVWHQHDDTDETFIVLAGRLDRPAGGPRRRGGRARADVHRSPDGLPHCPVAPGECHLLLLEPAGTRQHRRPTATATAPPSTSGSEPRARVDRSYAQRSSRTASAVRRPEARAPLMEAVSRWSPQT